MSAISCCMLAIAMCLRLMVMRDNRIRGCVCVATAVHGELDQRYTVLRLTKFSIVAREMERIYCTRVLL